jgi:HAD superfamily hydrolase (TIGR01509 family)
MGKKMKIKQPMIRAVIWDTAGVLHANSHYHDGLAAFIRAMRPYYRTALFCRSWAELQGALLQRWELADAFHQVILAPTQGEHPSPQIYFLAARQMYVRPEQAILVDALSERVEVARDAGMHTVVFQDPAQVGSDLFQLLQETV